MSKSNSQVYGRSLRLGNIKKEHEKINSENYSLHKRLRGVKSSLSRAKLLKETQKSQEVVKMLSKSRKFKPKYGRSIGSLQQLMPAIRHMPEERSFIEQIRKSEKFKEKLAEREYDAALKKYFAQAEKHIILEK